jgi:hypothetical protein
MDSRYVKIDKFSPHHFLAACLGGPRNFGKVIWTVKEHVHDGDSPYITFYYHSFDGEQGNQVECRMLPISCDLMNLLDNCIKFGESKKSSL